jgi:hypothetical protein
MSYPSPPPPPPNYVAYASPPPMVKDEEHLRLLAMFHYIYGALVAVLSSFGLIHLIMGIMMLRNPNMFPMPVPSGPGTAPFPFNPAYMFIIMGGMVVALGWTVGTLSIISGRCISFRRARTFSMVIAGINCLWVPFGTIIGVFTLVVLLRQSVATLYAYNRAQTPTY